jgi:hypothetical protein
MLAVVKWSSTCWIMFLGPSPWYSNTMMPPGVAVDMSSILTLVWIKTAVQMSRDVLVFLRHIWTARIFTPNTRQSSDVKAGSFGPIGKKSS